jgi:hypothetical protein
MGLLAPVRGEWRYLQTPLHKLYLNETAGQGPGPHWRGGAIMVPCQRGRYLPDWGKAIANYKLDEPKLTQPSGYIEVAYNWLLELKHNNSRKIYLVNDMNTQELHIALGSYWDSLAMTRACLRKQEFLPSWSTAWGMSSGLPSPSPSIHDFMQG